MNFDLANSCKCYGLYDNENIIGFCAVMHQPCSKNTKIKRCSRLVILPDYQGIGLGYKFLNVIAEHYVEKGYDFEIITSAKNFIYKLYSSDKWQMRRLSAHKSSKCKTAKIDRTRTSIRKVKTGSFFYVKR